MNFIQNAFYRAFIYCSLVLLCVDPSWAQNTLIDGPIQLQIRVRDIRVKYSSNGASDLNLNVGSLGLSNFEDDELSFKIWARDRGNISGGWQGGNCFTDELPMLGGGPDYTADFNQNLFSFTYPGINVPRYFDVAMEAHEDDIPSDFSIVSGLTSCGSTTATRTRCNYNTTMCCLNVFGCVLDAADDYPCQAGISSTTPFLQAVDYRYDSTAMRNITPCFWYDHGYLQGGCPNGDNEFYSPRIETYWRYTRGYGCNNAIDLGAFTGASPVLHYNNNSCYNNSWPASPGNDVTYTFTTVAPIGINANVCGVNGAQFDSYMYFLDSNCSIEESDDNGCGNQSTISAYICQPGTYYIVVDATAASELGTFTLSITEDSSFLFRASTVKTDVQCFGADDGTATVRALGGYPPYTYEWSTAPTDTDTTVTGLAPGTYTVTITDNKGCTITSSTSITEPTALADVMSSTNVSCSGAEDGTATVTPSGGTPPYTYIWGTQPFQVTQTAEYLAAGTYQVTVIDDNNCIIVDSVTVNTSTVITVTLNALNDVSCFGVGDGSIDISVSGGRAPYTYAWSNLDVTEDIVNLVPGTYSYTITDLDGCFVVDSFAITEPPLLVAGIDDTVNLSCNGGSDGIITIDVSGGTPGYQYLWSNGHTGQDLLNVPAGYYEVTVTDNNSCQAIIGHTLTEPAPLAIQWNLTDPSCFGDSTGAIDISVTGGTPPYKYLWSTNDTTEDLTGVPAGSYAVLVTDSFNCFLFEFNSLTTNPPVDVQVASVIDVNCNGGSTGSINLNVVGGLPPYTFTWSSPLATGQTPPGLQVGPYSVTVADALGCTDTISAYVDEPSAITVSVLDVTNVSCFGGSDGSIEVDITGGTQPYIYTWADGPNTEDRTGLAAGSYTLTVVDGKGCQTVVSNTVVTEPTDIVTSMLPVAPSCSGVNNGSVLATAIGGTPPYSYQWSNGESTSAINNVGAGTYTVIITDDKGCVAYDTATLAVAAEITISDTVVDLLCYGDANGEITLTIAGGTPPYTYAWSNSANTKDLSGLSGGTYDVVVTDNSGCTAAGSYVVDEPDSILMELFITPVKCYGDADGVAATRIEGGTPDYDYQWSDGQLSNVATGLDPGPLTLTVTDANGCVQTITDTVYGPDQLVITADTIYNVSCYDESDGGVIINVQGGTASYNYAVENVNFQPDGIFTGLEAGDYTALVLDGNNCQATVQFTITEPDEWLIEFPEPYVFTARGASVTLTPILDASVVPDEYFWEPAQGLSCTDCAEPIATPLETTTYTLNITDVNGCVQDADVAVVVKNDYELFLPNAFSPNGDGRNDVWVPIDFGSVRDIEISIFDRWGGKVFSSRSTANGWDGTYKGKIVYSETFVYVVEGTFLNGTEFEEHGSIAIVR